MENLNPEPILQAKIQLPAAPPRLVERPHLVSRLQAGRLSTRLSLVAAPAGFGKTALVLDWLNRPDLGAPVAWFSISDSDNNPQRFWNYLLGALDAAFELSAQPFLRLARSATGQPLPAEQIVTSFLNEFGRLNRPVILALDDYHFITSPEIHRSMAFLLDHQPPGLHLVITCRNEPPLPLARLRMRRQLTELRMPDLQLSPEEATALLNTTTGLTLSSPLVAKLQTRTEGWAAALHLSALLLQSGGDFEELIHNFSGKQRFMLDYLGEEVFQPQPDNFKNFLLQTSVAVSFNASLAEELTGCEDGQAMLDRVLGANLFLVTLDNQPGWYRYHYLFRQYLYNRLEQTQVEVLPLLHRAAARWYQEQEDYREAIEQALKGQDFDFAAGLIDRLTGELYQESDLKTLDRWLTTLPRPTVNRYLHTSLNRAWVLALTERAHLAEPFLENASTLAEKAILEKSLGETALASLQAELAGVGAFIERKKGNFAKAFALGERALAHLEESQGFFRCAVTLNQGHLKADLNDLNEAARYYNQTEKLGRALENNYFHLLGMVSLARLYLQFGHLPMALATARRALELTELQDYPAMALAYLVQGSVWLESNRLAEAAASLETGLKLAGSDLENGTLEILIELALLRQVENDNRAAWNFLQKAQALIYSSNQPVLFRKLDHASMRLRLAAEDLDAVEAWQAQLPHDEAVLPDYLLQTDRVIIARLHLAQGRPAQALELARELKGSSAGYTNFLLEGLCLEAGALYRQKQLYSALQALGEALGLAEPQKYVRLFLDNDDLLPAMLLKLAEPAREPRGFSQNYLERLLANLSVPTSGVVPVTPDSLPRSVQGRLPPRPPALPEPLTERETEVLDLLVNTTLSSSEIADQLVVAVSTVRSHIKSIYGKLEVQNRLGAIVRARELDLVTG